MSETIKWIAYSLTAGQKEKIAKAIKKWFTADRAKKKTSRKAHMSQHDIVTLDEEAGFHDQIDHYYFTYSRLKHKNE